MAVEPTIESIEESCIKCLKYFGIFSYPLSAQEVYDFSLVESSKQDVERALEKLAEDESIFKHDEFYLSQDNPDWVTERRLGNHRAGELLKKAEGYIKVISSFPFVRSVAISGSLSKNYASDDPDIDYFIIAEANRLWISRTLLHLFKKLTFITGHQHYYCMNYFIDTEALALSQRNQYAAIELVTLLPAYNSGLINDLLHHNLWLKKFVPNHSMELNTKYLIKSESQTIKKFFEKILNRLNPEKLNRWLMEITDKKWRKKWQHANYSPEEYHQALQTEIHISKNHPDNYEKIVLDSLSDHSYESQFK